MRFKAIFWQTSPDFFNGSIFFLGDGGGPLVCPRANSLVESYVQVGIVAWGVGCGEAIPGVYANVSQALCFIDWATRYLAWLIFCWFSFIIKFHIQCNAEI